MINCGCNIILTIKNSISSLVIIFKRINYFLTLNR
nr:MAG TPA: hypothetical protein [Caudoviricetes sp.]